MRKNQVREILADQTKRRKTILNYVLIIIVIFILSCAFFLVYHTKSKDYYISYKEKSDIDYKVYLKENDFFEEKYLDNNSRFIASLIDYINATLEYEINMSEKDINYQYSYRIVADVNVVETKSSKPLYSTSKELLNMEDLESHGKSNVKISENLKIDYNEYNDLINDFVAVYDLSDVNSTLTINMYIKVKGTCEKYAESADKEANISLVIPLTTKTVEIDIKNNLVESNDNILVCQENSEFAFIYLLIGIAVCIANIFVIYRLIRYISETRSAETIYDIELKRILNYYHSYIQKIKNKIDLKKGLGLDNYKECQFFRLESFTDMLEIRDNINAPILMSSNENNTATYFLILDVSNKAIYIYGLRVKDIKRQMKKRNKIDEEVSEENDEE